MRIWGLMGTLSLLILSAPPAASAVDPMALPVAYDETVYGDFAAIGNTVTACPAKPGHYPVKLCLDAQNRVGSGPSAQNNGHPMTWADVDSNASTFNSSTARLTIPAGARIAYAKLTWAGDTGEPANVPCGRGTKPPGLPQQQAVSLTVNDKTAAVKPARYTEDALNDLSNIDHQFYSASADVTGELRAVTGPVTVTVGNVWTPQGFDCFGGWSLVAVWAFDRPQPKVAPARKQVTVFDAHVHAFSGRSQADARLPAVKPAGGTSRFSVTGFEGDWAVPGDELVINGRNAGGTGNFFVSSADGRVNPNALNNMSVDVQTLDVGGDVLRPGDAGANLSFTSGMDAYLVGGIAVSAPRPELTIVTSLEQNAAHPGDQITQMVLVTNTGGAPAVDVRLTEDLGCDHTIDQLKAGQSVKASCTRAAPEQDKQLTARVTGQSLIGDKLAAEATTSLDIIRPAIAATKTASPTTVLSGQTVNYTITVRNTGDTPLTGVAVDDKQVDACDKLEPGELPSGMEKILECTVVAGDEGFTNMVTATGTDKIGKKVTSESRAAFTVVHPKIDFTVQPSTRAARPGEVVTFTVTVGNPTGIPLGAVRVTGTPPQCTREIGDLAPKKSTTYTCQVVMGERLTTELTVTASPIMNGQLIATRRDTVTRSITTTVSVVTPVTEQPPVKKAAAVPPAPPAPIAMFVAGLAAVSTFVTVGAISATARPKK
ncbi:putative repeat protein (TIGR01451 family) [Kibdelosporangium banguiense]|uniref:Repeat protein (TIGR01451 family) n=1 Tax=Kibdelosporangium banguiense TaxID=1365924 RepID=A0ABS4U187_9PSEU|nr:DUF11 domain-containing protein [Kibdelosporangium banguiense]MBP2329994.1 putative repeat protein (TIGR01451 family) [Kibdelosporangium banguiense]